MNILSSNPVIKKLLTKQHLINQHDVKNIAETIIFNKKMIQELLNMSGFLHSRVVLQRANPIKEINEYLTIETEKTKYNLNNSTLNNHNNLETIQSIFNIDYFAFNFLRSISNASLTTGANLREEENLNLSIQGLGKNALHELRKELNILPLENPYPTLLTSGKTNIDFNKPFFYGYQDPSSSSLAAAAGDDGNGNNDNENITVEQQPCAIFTNAKTANEIGDQFLTYNDETDCKRFLKDNCLVLGFNEEELHSKMAMITLYSQYQQAIKRKRILLEAGPSTADPILNSIDFFLLTVIEDMDDDNTTTNNNIIVTKDNDSNNNNNNNNNHVLDDEIMYNSGLQLMNENVYIENSYKVKFQSYIHQRYNKRLIDKERGYWEILNEW